MPKSGALTRGGGAGNASARPLIPLPVTRYQLQKFFPGARIAAALAIGMVIARTAPADAAVKILIPSDDSCSAYLAAANSGDRAAMLNLGGWSLGYWSGLAAQSGKDILHDTTSESLLDQLAASCQGQPNTPLSSIVAAIGRALLARPTP